MQAESTPQRKYALTRIGPGDYLLPSNDGRTIWRIAKYEDGPSHGLDRDAMDRDRDFWGLWKYNVLFGVSGTHRNHVDVEDWDRWGMEAAHFDTRREAIDEALRIGGSA